MAANLNESPFYGRQWRYGILPESTLGTQAITDPGAGEICALRVEPVNVDRGINIREIRSAHGSMNPIYDERVQNSSGSMASFTLEGPINGFAGGAQSPFELLAACHFQYQSAGVYSYFSTHPSTDGVDNSFTFFWVDPTAGRAQIYPGCVVKALDLTFERNELVTMSTECACVSAGSRQQTVTTAGLAPSGSTAPGAPVASFEDFTYQTNIDGTGDTNATVQTINVHFEHDEIVQLGPAGDGTYSALGFVGRNNCTFTITMLRDTESVKADEAYEKGQTIKLTITAGTSLSNSWDFTDLWVSGKVESVEYGLDEGMATTTLNCKMLAADSSTNFAELDLN